jgi:hypothetical protein
VERQAPFSVTRIWLAEAVTGSIAAPSPPHGRWPIEASARELRVVAIHRPNEAGHNTSDS